MSNSDREKFSLSINLPHPDLVVSVLDGHGRLCAAMGDDPDLERQAVEGEREVQYFYNVGDSITPSLPRGLYRVVSKLGGKTEELAVRLNRDRSVVAEVPKVYSAVPLEESRISHEYYTVPAMDISQTATHAVPGGEPTFMLFVRALDEEHALQNMISCRLCDADQTELVNTAVAGARWDDQFGWFGFSANLEPGGYILEIDDGYQTRALPVWVSESFQTQLFALNLRDGIAYDSLRLLNARKGIGFQPDDPLLRTSELMTTALVAGMQQPRGKAMSEALQGKFNNPIVGLLAAHSLFRRPKVPTGLLNTVVGNLGWMLKGSPDVKVLELMLARLENPDFTASEPLKFPPVMKASYSGLLDAAEDQPQLIEPGSLCDRIGVGMFSDSPFVSWDPEAVTHVEGSALDWVKESIVDSVVQRARFGRHTAEPGFAKLSQTLGVTNNVIEQAARSLVVDAGGEPEEGTFVRLLDMAEQAPKITLNNLTDVKLKLDTTALDSIKVLLDDQAFKNLDG